MKKTGDLANSQSQIHTPPPQEIKQIEQNIQILAKAHNDLITNHKQLGAAHNELAQNFNLLAQNFDSLIKHFKILRHGFLRTLPQAYIGLVEIQLAEHCNLNCKGCSHFSQLASKELIDLEILERDFARLSDLSDKLVGKIHLMGGEPLLHPKVNEIMILTRKYFPNAIIKLVTNGVLLPKQNDDFYKTAAAQGVIIAPTPYPLKIDWDSVNAKIAKYSCEFEWFDGGEPNQKTFRRFALDENGRQNARTNFMCCGIANSCTLLRDGKLYTCSIIGNIKHFNKYFEKKGELKKALEVGKNDYIDIHKARDYNEILQFIAKPAAFCRFCKVDEWVETGTWELSKREINEYF